MNDANGAKLTTNDRLARIEKSLDLTHEKLDRMNVDFRVHERAVGAHGVDALKSEVEAVRRRLALYAGGLAVLAAGANLLLAAWR